MDFIKEYKYMGFDLTKIKKSMVVKIEDDGENEEENVTGTYLIQDITELQITIINFQGTVFQIPVKDFVEVSGWNAPYPRMRLEIIG